MIFVSNVNAKQRILMFFEELAGIGALSEKQPNFSLCSLSLSDGMACACGDARHPWPHE